MCHHAIEQFFKTVTLSSFSGSLQALAQIISRNTGVYVKGHDVLEYIYSNKGLHNYSIKLYIANDDISIVLVENN